MEIYVTIIDLRSKICDLKYHYVRASLELLFLIHNSNEL